MMEEKKDGFDVRSLLLSVLFVGIVVWSYDAGGVAESANGEAEIQSPSSAVVEMVSSDVTEKPQQDTVESVLMPASLFLVSLPRAEEVSRFETPQRRDGVPDIVLDARAAFAVTDQGGVLFEQNVEEALQIASISKLMTALVALDALSLEDLVEISAEAVRTEGDAGRLVVGETLSLHDALLALLVASSNDVAVAIAEETGGVEVLVSAMNAKAREMELSSARFTNPHGLTPLGNFASAREVVQLLEESLAQPVIREMLRQGSVAVESEDGFLHLFKNTGGRLLDLPGVVGLKTGYTTESKGTLVFAFAPHAALEKRAATQSDDVVTTVVLGSSDRIADTEAFMQWILGAYVWD